MSAPPPRRIPACNVKVPANSTEEAGNIVVELLGNGHPRNKLISNTNKSGVATKRGRGRPPTHGLSRTPLYTSYREAKRRCENALEHPDYPGYGGRGIKFNSHRLPNC